MRSQFTFYESFFRALQRIKKDADRAKCYDAICGYAMYGTEPDYEKLPESAAIAFDLIRPNLDASKRKAESGKRGGTGKKDESEPEANGKQTGSKPEANGKQEQTASEKEDEKEDEGEIEKENECYTRETHHKYGKYGWVKLTDAEYKRLIDELGETEALRCIDYVDESAQSTGNKNRWKDWNLTVRKCSRDGWGRNKGSLTARATQVSTADRLSQMIRDGVFCDE